MQLTIYGCGALGARVARRWEGPLTLVTRSDARRRDLQAAHPGAKVVLDPVVEGALLLAVPASAQPEVIARLPPVDGPAVQVSTTSVHRPYRGTITPSSSYGRAERAQTNAATERAFLRWAGDRGRIVRLGGLFSEQNGPAAVFARRGTARERPPNATLPLIHYDDAATLVLQALASGPQVRLGVVHQPSRRAFYAYWADQLGVAEPSYSEPVDQPAVFEGSPLPDPIDWRRDPR